ncbi:MAG TPA: ABC transporter permease [Candidatus Limnocylindria bacterium]|nr:ABC transporter permease [Candidatus Limnocylindria bacterium]
MNPVASLFRVSSFLGKELREVVRRPGIIAALILGPFGIMLIFGLGYTGSRRPIPTELVLPAELGLPADPATFSELSGGRLDVVRVSEDPQAAMDRLERQEVDLVVIAPADARERLRRGEQSTLQAAWNEVDPVDDSLARLGIFTMTDRLNREIIRVAAAEGITLAAQQGQPVNISPDVIAEPARVETENVAPTQPATLAFFGPAVFALVVQHMALTLASLSMIRERFGGQLDLFRVSPLNASEILLGKYLAYGLLTVLVGAIVAALMVYVLGVPLLGGWGPVAGIVALLAFASLGVGLLISLFADSERQAVQLAMLFLLASVFFSGFVLPVEEFVAWVRGLALVLPVTHGIATLQDSMLRGAVGEEWMLAVLAGIGVVCFVICLIRLRLLLRSAA